MPGIDGIELVRTVRHMAHAPALVFVTAHASSAVARTLLCLLGRCETGQCARVDSGNSGCEDRGGSRPRLGVGAGR